MEAAALMSASKQPEAARKLLDFIVSEQANRLYAKSFAVVAVPQAAIARADYPADIQGQMIDNDFAWAASERDTILKEWTQRFDGKSEAKQ